MERNVLQLAQLLHTVQQQQVTAQSVASATLTHLALQLKQLEQVQAEQAQQLCPSLQQAAPRLLEQSTDVERDQPLLLQQQQEAMQQQLQEIQMQQSNTKQLLHSLQEQQVKLAQQLEMVLEQQQQWQGKQERLLQLKLDQVLLFQQRELSGVHLGLQQSMNIQLQQEHAADCSSEQQFQQTESHHKDERGLQQCDRGVAEHPTAQHQQEQEQICSITDVQQVQHDLAQQHKQQEQGLETLQSDIHDLTSRLELLQDQQQQLQQLQHLTQEADAAASEQGRQSKQHMEDALAGLEGRLLHAVRLEAEVQQHMVELRVKANYESMKSDVAAVQKEVAKQLQQLTNDLQDAMTAMKSHPMQDQQHQCQIQQQAAGISSHTARSTPAVRLASSHAAAAGHAWVDAADKPSTGWPRAACNAEMLDQQQRAMPEQAPLAQLTTRTPSNSCSAEIAPVSGHIDSAHNRPIAAAAGSGYVVSGLSNAEPLAAPAGSQLHEYHSSADLQDHYDSVGGVDGCSRRVLLNRMSSKKSVISGFPVQRKQLNDLEMDVVLGLLDAIHSNKNLVQSIYSLGGRAAA